MRRDVQMRRWSSVGIVLAMVSAVVGVVGVVAVVQLTTATPAGATSAYASAVSVSSPVGYWRLGDAGSPTFVHDETGVRDPSRGGMTMGHAGALLNDSDTAAYFGSSGNDAVYNSIQNHSPTFWSPSGTAELWFNPDTTTTAGTLFNLTAICGNNKVMKVGVDSSGHFTADVSMDSAPSTVAVDTVTSPVVSTAGQWHQVVVTAGSGLIVLYVDGIQVLQTAATYPYLHDCSSVPSDQENMSIGAGAAPPGAIDEVAFYTRQLTYAEVQTHYQASGRVLPLVAAAKYGAPNHLMPCVGCMLKQLGKADPVDASTGNFQHGFTDLAIPGRGIPLSFSHTYNSALSGVDGLLGRGWVFNWDMHLELATDLVTVHQEGGAAATFIHEPTGLWSPGPYTMGTLTHTTSPDQWTLQRDRLETMVFDSTGQLISIADLNGETTTLSYPSVTSPVTSDIEVTDSASRTMSIVTATVGSNSVTTVTDPIGRTVSFIKDTTSHHLTSFTDLRGQTTSFTYTGDLVETMTDPNGGVTTNQYDGSDRVTDQWSPKQSAIAGSGTLPGGAPVPGGAPTHFDYSVTDQTSITDPEGNVEIQEYSDGFLVSDTRAAGTADEGTWTYTYDPVSGGLATVTDPNSHVTTTTWFSAANCDPATEDCQYGRVSSVDNGVDPATTYEYESVSGLPLKVKDGQGQETTYTYDNHVNLHTVSAPANASTPTVNISTTTYTHPTSGHLGDVSSITDPRGKVWPFAYDSYGNTTAAEDPYGNETTTGFDLVGRPVWTVSPKGNAGTAADYRSTMLYDDGDLPVATTDPAAKAVSDGFNRANGTLGTAESGQTWTATSGTFGTDDRGVSLTTAAGGSAANLATVTAPADLTVGATLGAAPDDLGVTFRAADSTHWWSLVARPSSNYFELMMKNGAGAATPLGNTGSGTCCTAGTRVQVRAVGTAIKVYVDGQLTLSVTNSTLQTNTLAGIYAGTTGTGTLDDFYGARADGAVATTGYDDNGNTIWSLDPNAARTSTVFDANDQPTTVTRPDSSTQQYTWDRNGRRTSYTDGLTNTTTWGYDHQGRVISDQPPGKTATTVAYTYGTGGETDTITQPGGGTITKSMNVLGQLTAVNYSDAGTPDVTAIGYDHVGRRTSLTTAGATYASTWTYDSLGRLTSSSRDNRAVAYEYDLAGNRTKLTYPGSLDVTYTYDDAGRMITLDDWANSAYSFGWDADANPTSTLFPNGVTTTRTFDTDDRPTVISIDNTGGNIQTFTQTYDVRSQITKVQTSPTAGYANYVYSYDGDGRELTGPDGGNTFDAADNPIGQNSKTQTFDASGEICWQVGGTSTNACGSMPSGGVDFDHDGLGNRTKRTPAVGFTSTSTDNTYVYDQANRMVEYDTTGSVSGLFIYDGDGIRLNKTEGSLSTDYTWDDSGGLPMMLKDGSDAYVYGPSGEALERITSASTPVTTFIHQDHLGSTRILTDASGNKSGFYNYTLWGRISGSTGTAQVNLRYAGEYYDAGTQFYYLRARYYDPRTAQFITADPAYLSTLERYGYGSGDPINRRDPSGLCAAFEGAAYMVDMSGEDQCLGDWIAAEKDRQEMTEECLAFAHGHPEEQAICLEGDAAYRSFNDIRIAFCLFQEEMERVIKGLQRVADQLKRLAPPIYILLMQVIHSFLDNMRMPTLPTPHYPPGWNPLYPPIYDPPGPVIVF